MATVRGTGGPGWIGAAPSTRGQPGEVRGEMRAAVLFPGQGSQHAGMADSWLEHPAGRKRLEECSSVLGWDIVEASRDEKALGRTETVQLAVVACELAAYDVLTA